MVVIGIVPAVGLIVFFLIAGYPEAIFMFPVFWGLSYLLVSYVTHRVFPPQLVSRYHGPLVTLNLNETDD